MAPVYVNPIPPGAVGKAGDSGRDYQGKPGDYVLAPGAGTITYAGPQSGFGQAVYLQIKGGPKIYIGHSKPVVKTGSYVKAGQPISQLVKRSGGDAANLPGWFEIGIASRTINAPMYHGQGHAPNTEGSQAIEQLIKGGTTPTPTTQTPPVDTGSTGGSQQADTSVDTQGVTVGADDPVLSSMIQQIPQTEGPALSTPSLAGSFNQAPAQPMNPNASTWAMIAANGPVSTDTVRLAQLAGYGGNAAPSG